MGVSENSGTPKSSILMGFSIIFTIHFGGNTPIFGNTHIYDSYEPPKKISKRKNMHQIHWLQGIIVFPEKNNIKFWHLKMDEKGRLFISFWGHRSIFMSKL